MRTVLSAIFLLTSLAGLAQTATELHQTGRGFLNQGDFSNAILVLTRANTLEPKNIEIGQDLALSHYFAGDNAKSLQVIKNYLDADDATDQCFKIAADNYGALQDAKECEKTLRRGLKKFSTSGILYNSLGEVLWAKQDESAIKQWEKGIELDPLYSRNYLSACRHYYLKADYVWAVIYGELFINMEPFGSNTPELKNLLLESYKKFFTGIDWNKTIAGKKGFEAAFLKTLQKQSSLAYQGINAESLTMIRARFILDWYQEYASTFPYKLFEIQQHYLQVGLFDVYNQWIFGAAQNLAAYDTYTKTHADTYSEFTRYLKSRIFKMPEGQYYH